MLVRMWKNWIAHVLLVGMKNSLAIALETKHITII